MAPTRWPVHVYRVDYKAPPDDAYYSGMGNETPQPYIFNARAHRTRVRVCTGAQYRLLPEDQCGAVADDPSKASDILVLGDTGATHSLIPLRIAKQLGLEIDHNRRGRVVLGDQCSGVPILGQCIVPITIGKYHSQALALVIDVNWDDTQHLVLGSDWIRANRAMLGAGSGKGPQMDIRGPQGDEFHTVFARKFRNVRPMREVQPDDIMLSAARFAAMLEEGTYQGQPGRPWTAVDVSAAGVQIGDDPRMPLREFLGEDVWFQYCLLCPQAALQSSTATSPAQHAPAQSADQEGTQHTAVANPAHAKYQVPDMSSATPAGIPASILQSWKSGYPKVFQEDLPDRSMSAPVTPRPETVHAIPLLPNAKPVFRKQWRLSPLEKAEIAKQLKYHIAKGLIQPSSSPWGAPILFTPKPDGTLRMCIDYRGLNAVTERDVYPLPRAEDLYARVKGNKVFSSLDLLKGYWQIGLQPRDRHLTAFVTPEGLWEYKVLPMGLTNAPATFQRMMMRIFGDLFEAGKVMVYLDDILVMTKTVEEHDLVMRDVLDRLTKNNLIVRFDKCKFGQDELKFLGFIISGDTVRADPKKTQAVRDWPVPDTATALRGFLGLANYFRRFIPGYATLAAPLTALTGGKKNAHIVLQARELAAFEAIKQMLISPPILSVEDPGKPYEVITDASVLGIGAVLLQRDEEGRPKVIAYESKAFAAKRASVTAKLNTGATLQHPDGSISLDQAALEDASGKQELTALLHALKVWRCYLEGADFTVYVDHNPLTYLLTKPHLNRWQVRILDTLATYPGMKVQHIPGSTNIADGLSRIRHHAPPAAEPTTVQQAALQCMSAHDAPLSFPLIHRRNSKPTKHAEPLSAVAARLSAMFVTASFFQARPTRITAAEAAAGAEDLMVATRSTPGAPQGVVASDAILNSDDEAVDNASRQPGRTLDILQQEDGASLADTFLQRCANGYTRDPRMKELIAEQQGRQPGSGVWKQHRGLWFSEGALVVPNHGSLRQDCISQYHDPPQCGHPGALKTRKAVERFYWWPTLSADVEAYVRTCDSCQRMKPSRLRPAGLLQPLPIPAEKLKHWVCDLAVKLPRTEDGFDAVLVLVDRKTRYTLLVPCPAVCPAEELAKLVIEALRPFGYPRSIICDSDSRFTNKDGPFQVAMRGVGCVVKIASVDHHETVGLAERTIQSVKEHLRHYINATHTNWARLLMAVQCALNNGFCVSLNTTPSYLVFGMHPDQPGNLPSPDGTPPEELEQALHAQWLRVEREAAERLEKARMRMMVAANAKRRDEEYHVGDQVLLSTRHPWFQAVDGVRKLIPAWVGPFKVLRVDNKVTCTVELPQDIKCDNRFHVHLLKRYHPDTRVIAPPPTVLIDGHEEFEVEAVLKHRDRRVRGGSTRREYRVAFTGYGPHYNKWLPESNMEGCQRAIAEYWQRDAAGIGKRAISGSIVLVFLTLFYIMPCLCSAIPRWPLRCHAFLLLSCVRFTNPYLSALSLQCVTCIKLLQLHRFMRVFCFFALRHN